MIPVVVRNVVQEARAVVRVVFGSVDGSALPRFDAGSHIDVHLPNGLIRQYSLCRLQVEPQYYEIAVLKDPQSRGGSLEVHSLTIGDSLTISAPKNHFPVLENTNKSVLIAGGIGVTPLLTMAQHLQNAGRPFEFHYCAKSPDTAAFAHTLEEASFKDKMHFHYSQVPGSGRMQVTKVLQRQAENTDLYVCGPVDFMQHVILRAQSLDWPQECLHKEFFAAPNVDVQEGQNQAFKVKIHSTGEVFDVAPDQAIYEVLESHDVFIPVACVSGVCGTCQTGVVAGTPDHRDVFLTAAEQAEDKWVMPCCSRSKTPILELDL